MAIERIICANRPEWLRARRALGVGGSEAAAILGLSRFRSPAEVYFEKTTGLTRESDEDAPGHLWWGLRMEPLIAERFTIETGYPVEDTGDYTIFRDTEKPWRYVTLDRWAQTPEGGAPLELKNTRAMMRKYWSDGVPLEVQIQIQQQIAVMGAERGFVAVVHEGSDFAYYEVPRHEGFIALLDARTREFWENTKRGIVPIDGDRRTRDLINEAYEARVGSAVTLPAELAEWDQRRVDAMQTIKAAEALKNEAESRILLALGEAAQGTIEGTRVTWKRTPVKGSTYTVNRKDSYRLARSEKR